MIAYHFTSAVHWPLIEQAGVLKRTESNLDMFRPHAGPDVVWLLDGPELGASHGLHGSSADKTQIRFEVEASDRWTVPWLSWVNAQGIDTDWLDTLVRTGGGIDAAKRWLISFKQIGQADWRSVVDTSAGEVLWPRE